MANPNDQKILELKKQIELKKEKLSKSQKFTPITNCSIEIDGVRHNIQVLQKEQILTLLIKINTYVLSSKDLGLLDSFNINGYHVLDWIADLKLKYEILNRKEEEQKLKAMETKLDKLLSDDKKVELELDEIAALLN
ncbi:hypothetical protein [Paenibacillus sp. FSL H3-0286]|uniref:hypothetical protein n=1 Tax=Paenibacillus sp. FSL H3-0286 TaxID=2921427 RepID=UPI00324A23F7